MDGIDGTHADRLHTHTLFVQLIGYSEMLRVHVANNTLQCIIYIQHSHTITVIVNPTIYYRNCEKPSTFHQKSGCDQMSRTETITTTRDAMTDRNCNDSRCRERQGITNVWKKGEVNHIDGHRKTNR